MYFTFVLRIHHVRLGPGKIHASRHVVISGTECRFLQFQKLFKIRYEIFLSVHEFKINIYSSPAFILSWEFFRIKIK